MESYEQIEWSGKWGQIKMNIRAKGAYNICRIEEADNSNGM